MTPDVRRVVVWAANLLVAMTGYTGEYAKGGGVTLVVPPTAFATEVGSWAGRIKYIANVTCDAQGKLVLNGDENWRRGALPWVIEGTITEVKPKPKDGFTLFVVSAMLPREAYPKDLRFEIRPSCKDWTTAMDEIAVLTSKGLDDAYGLMVAERLKPYFQLQADQVFVGDLANIDRQLQIEIISAAHSVEPSIGFFSDVFRDSPYFGFDLGNGHLVYNTLQVNQNQRLAREITDRVFPLLKVIAPLVRDAELSGIKVKLAVAYRDFLNQSSSGFDQVSMYLDPYRVILFAEAEITNQALIDATVVLVNDSRVEVVLTEQ